MRREPVLAALLCVVGAFLVLVGAGRSWVAVTVAGSPLLPPREVGVAGSALSPGLTALGLAGLAGVLALAASRGRGRTAVGLVVLGIGLGVLASVVAVVAGDVTAHALATAPVRDAGGAQGRMQGAAVQDGGAQAATSLTGWPVVCGLGGLLLVGAGLLVALRGRRWAALGRRYEPPVAGAGTGGSAAALAAVAGAAGAGEGACAGAPGAAPEPAAPHAGPPLPDPDPAPGPASPSAADRELWEALDRGEDPTA